MEFIIYITKEFIRYIKKLHIHNWECIDIFDSNNYKITEGRSVKIYKCYKCGEYRYSNIGVADWLDKEMLHIDESDYLTLKELSNLYLAFLKRKERIKRLKEWSKKRVYKRAKYRRSYVKNTSFKAIKRHVS